MAKRIKILIDGSGIDGDMTHLIYRNTEGPDLPADNPVIETREHDVNKRSLPIQGEVLTQDGDNAGLFYVSRVFSLLTEPTVYIDGVPITNSHVTWNPRERSILIEFEQIEPATSKVITMDYHFMASVIEDDYTAAQPGVTFHHNENVSGINAPVHVGNAFDHLTGQYAISIERDTTPAEAWYWVGLREDVSGRETIITGPQHIEITPNLYDLLYTVEKNAEVIGTFRGNTFEITDPNILCDELPPALPVTITRSDATTATVAVKNPWFNWWEDKRQTAEFSIREEDADGEVSSFTVIPRGEVAFKPSKLTIRRKQENGAPSTYDGEDAMTMKVYTESDVDISQQTLSFIDDHLDAEKEYSYTFFVEDEIGRRSLPFMGQTNEVSA